MSIAKIMAILILSTACTTNPMKRRHDDGDMYSRQLTESTDQARVKKSQFPWREPQYLKHGAYLAHVINNTDTIFRISQVGLKRSEQAGNLTFAVDYSVPITPLELAERTSNLQSKVAHIDLEPVVEEEESAEIACLQIEDIMNPRIIKYLWIRRFYTNHRVEIFTHFNESSQNPTEESRPIVKPISKLISRIRLEIADETLEKMKVQIFSFVC